MNAEKLFSIIKDVELDFEDTDVLSLFNRLISSLENIVNSPATPDYQTTFITTKGKLFEALEDSYLNSESPKWWQTVDEIGLKNILGNQLKARIEPIIANNQLTPANAVKELKEIETEVKNKVASVKQAVNALLGLNIGIDTLEAGECEIAYSIPRATNSQLSALDKETHELKFILERFSEVVTGDAGDFEVRSISSSDYTFYISVGLGLAAFVGKTTDWILSKYKEILEIKKLKLEIQKLAVPDKITNQLEEHANGLMEKQIKEYVSQAMKENKINYNHGKTKPEVSSGLEFAINKLANRLDRGFHLTLRVEPLEESEEEAPTIEETKLQEQIGKVQTYASKLDFQPTFNQPILSLPESSK